MIAPGSRADGKPPAALLRAQRLGARCAALLAACALLAQCAAVPTESAAAPPAPSDYRELAAKTVKDFQQFKTSSDLEISAPRFIHAQTGWNWLVCLRYADRGHPRYYAIFIDGNKVVNSRYEILTDRCGAQPYEPFDLAAAVKPPPPVPQRRTD